MYYMAQFETRPPRFAIQVNDRGRVTRDYAYFLENRLRETWRLHGVPLSGHVHKVEVLLRLLGLPFEYVAAPADVRPTGRAPPKRPRGPAGAGPRPSSSARRWSCG